MAEQKSFFFCADSLIYDAGGPRRAVWAGGTDNVGLTVVIAEFIFVPNYDRKLIFYYDKDLKFYGYRFT